ncbi:hypothetical protein P4T70_26505 [Bacillus mobilis]|uniref:hypothetical protein n=1 Tax=Bacillus cereus group TaxID=86661 RepID=UPI0029C20F7D|nr:MULTISPECIES: hypothetical protein [Bacillus cereus group]MDX5808504.1 hypothetical protein [Bacillus cereus group sp. BfR-BA-02730]MED0951615.1 hypothetical protein [Bacillus mobilis]
MDINNTNKVQKAIELLKETTDVMDISEQTGLKTETITLLMDSDAEMIERVINSFLNDEGYVLEEPFINELKRSIELRDKYLSDQRTRMEGAWEEGMRVGKEQMKIKVAKSLLAENWSLEEISKYIKLERDVLKELKNELNC